MRPPLSVSRTLKGIGYGLLCLFLVWLGGSVVHAFTSARIMAHKSTCSANVKQILLGNALYMHDWDERLPPSQQWATAGGPHIAPSSEAPIWHCPDAGSPYSYAFNAALGGVSSSDMAEPALTVEIFEADANVWNAVGGKSQLAKEPRHPWGLHYGFADGHVNGYRANPEQLQWQPLLLPGEKRH